MQRESTSALATVVGVDAVAAVLARAAWLPGGPGALAHAAPDRSLPLVLALALAGFALWLTATVLAGLAAQAPGATGRWATATLRRLAPRAVRNTLAVTLGLTVLTSTAGAAQAASPVGHVATTQSAPTFSLDWPVPSPPVVDLDRPAPNVHHDPSRGLSLVTPVPRRVPVPQEIPADTVVVQPGDSLWQIAASHLPRGAGRDAIERAWHQWYRTNRAVIGPDPGLIQPGQHLTPPAS